MAVKVSAAPYALVSSPLTVTGYTNCLQALSALLLPLALSAAVLLAGLPLVPPAAANTMFRPQLTSPAVPRTRAYYSTATSMASASTNTRRITWYHEIAALYWQLAAVYREVEEIEEEDMVDVVDVDMLLSPVAAVPHCHCLSSPLSLVATVSHRHCLLSPLSLITTVSHRRFTGS